MQPWHTSCPVSSTHSLEHCFLASISTLNMVQTESGIRKSVDLLAFCILESNADLVLWKRIRGCVENVAAHNHRQSVRQKEKQLCRWVRCVADVGYSCTLSFKWSVMGWDRCGVWRLNCLDLWPLDAGLHHVTGHQFESLLQMFGELGLRPVEVHHKHLQSVQLPEQILWSGWAITGEKINIHETPDSTAMLSLRGGCSMKNPLKLFIRNLWLITHCCHDNRWWDGPLP